MLPAGFAWGKERFKKRNGKQRKKKEAKGRKKEKKKKQRGRTREKEQERERDKENSPKAFMDLPMRVIIHRGKCNDARVTRVHSCVRLLFTISWFIIILVDATRHNS